MTLTKNHIGSSGKTVVGNIRALRGMQSLNYTQLSSRIADEGRLISAVGVRRIEALERRIDVDDLTAIAAALNTTPTALLNEDAADHYRRDCLRWLLAEDNHHNATEVIQ